MDAYDLQTLPKLDWRRLIRGAASELRFELVRALGEEWIAAVRQDHAPEWAAVSPEMIRGYHLARTALVETAKRIGHLADDGKAAATTDDQAALEAYKPLSEALRHGKGQTDAEHAGGFLVRYQTALADILLLVSAKDPRVVMRMGAIND